jgi:myo-inositol-1(or 4)-monophosphatase
VPRTGDLNVAIRAATAAGKLLKSEFAKDPVVLDDHGRDIKLQADLLAERMILDILRRETSYPILSEEQGADSNFSTSDYYWVVDPLDGTFNFSRRLPFCAVSIGLWKVNEPISGVIHEFITGRTFSGVVGEGSWVDGLRLSVSGTERIDRAVVLTGFPSDRSFSTESLGAFVKKAQAYKKVRLIGSAALSLAYVASGLADLYHEEDIFIWDVAAGLALVKAAGGQYRMEPGRSRWQFNVLATNHNLAAVAALA